MRGGNNNGSLASGGCAKPATVSVIVATNRASPFLEEALRSVARQTHQPLEVIVVDDGSEDAALISRAAAAVHGARVVRQPASGVAVARNIGATEAHGEFLVFLDDDDRWHPSRVAVQLRALADAPEAVVGYCGMQSIDAAGHVVAAADQKPVADECDIVRRVTGIILPNIMMRRTAFETAGGFDPSLRLAEDLDLVLKLARQGPFAFSPEVLVDYRSHPNNATKRHRELCRSIDQVLRAHMQDAAERNDTKLVKAHRDSLRANGRFAWWSALRSAREALGERRIAVALGEIAWALRFAPWGVLDALFRRIRKAR